MSYIRETYDVVGHIVGNVGIIRRRRFDLRRRRLARIQMLDSHEESRISTGSEYILMDYASASSLNAKDIKRLSEDILHNSDFNTDHVDKDMLEQFANFIDSGDSKIISMHQERN